MQDALSDVAARIDAPAIIDIVIVSLAIYWLLLLIRGTTAMTVLRGVAVLLLSAFIVSRILDLTMFNWILRNSVTGLVIAVLIVFQPEMRRALERLGRTGLHSAFGRQEYQELIEIVKKSTSKLAQSRTGALIILERETGLQDVIDTGIRMNSVLSEEVLTMIFDVHSPLHDGAVVLRRDRVIAAGCTLPLSEAPLPPDHGMRHRAGMGIAELTDAVVVIVSEERGSISLASNGRLITDLDLKRLDRQLHRLFGLIIEDETLNNQNPANTMESRT
ncbi:MAG: TIGR00159 family protein [Chloroflexi bacterium]|mgnify:FL=1|jgi:diadenylate cyclase|nr:TIGR00159 family protein [Chloroflexota bacterium]|tara:strand:+ start:9620 stop:10444 length:825 start_codon:yes stop_codon:yes gene_type:complete